jgi:hypothetical protein
MADQTTMDSAAKPRPSSAHRVRLAVTWLLFIVFGALLGFGIVIYEQSSTHLSGLAMAIIGIIGIAALATSLRVARGRAVGNRRRVYTGGIVTGSQYAGGMNLHNQWFHHNQMWEQRRRDDEYYQNQQQQNIYQQQQQQQQLWNNY